jgi:hypothetical protein
MMNALVTVLLILGLVLLVDNVLDRIMSSDPYEEIVPADPFVPDDIQ